jgi:hypothetical protein
MGLETDIKKKNVDQNVILKMNKDITYEKVYLNAFEIAKKNGKKKKKKFNPIKKK